MLHTEILGLEALRADVASMARALDPPGKWLDVAAHVYLNPFLEDVFKQSGPGWPPVKRGGQPLKDLGNLSRSFASRPVPNGVEIYAPSVQAALMNYGGTVTPKGHPYLAIPIMENGSERRTAKPKQYQNTFVARSRNGNLVIFQTVTKASKGKRAVIRPLFVLKESVTIPARPFLVFNAEAISTIEDGIADWYSMQLTQAVGSAA